ncbi:MAG: flagellar basal body P-ring formation chaperone FlgA [Alsobacter sp.]
MNATTRTITLLLTAVALGFCATATFVVPVLAQPQAPAPQPQAAPAPVLARPLMKQSIVVSRDIIALGDVVENAGAAAETPAFRAPALGRTGTIQASRVADAVRQAGLRELDTGFVGQVVVTRAARKIARAEIEEAVRKALAGRYGLEQADVSLTLEGNESAVFVEPEAVGDVRVQDLVLDGKTQRLEAVIAVQGSRALTLKPLRVAGQIVDSVEVPVLARGVARGEAVRPSDVRLERRPRAEVNQVAVADVGQLAGRTARQQLQAGAVLREGDLAKQDIVEKNSVVTMVYETPGLQLSLRGKAMEGGGMGDVILVQNLQSKRSVQGVVSGPGRVNVTFATPGPVAAASPPPGAPAEAVR